MWFIRSEPCTRKHQSVFTSGAIDSTGSSGAISASFEAICSAASERRRIAGRVTDPVTFRPHRPTARGRTSGCPGDVGFGARISRRGVGAVDAPSVPIAECRPSSGEDNYRESPAGGVVDPVSRPRARGTTSVTSRRWDRSVPTIVNGVPTAVRRTEAQCRNELPRRVPDADRLRVDTGPLHYSRGALNGDVGAPLSSIGALSWDIAYRSAGTGQKVPQGHSGLPVSLRISRISGRGGTARSGPNWRHGVGADRLRLGWPMRRGQAAIAGTETTCRTRSEPPADGY